MDKPGGQEEPAAYCGVLEALISEIAEMFPPVLPRDLHRDLLTVRRRVIGEGFGFLCLVLPRLGDAVVLSLEVGRLVIPSDIGFPTSKGRNTPAFLPYLFTRVFHADGTLRLDACPSAIWALRQICSFFSKLERPVGSWCTSHIEAFHERVSTVVHPPHGDGALAIARHILVGVFKDFDPRDIIGRHGPGAVADFLKVDEKWDHSQFCAAVDYWYPREDYFSLPSTVRKSTRERSPEVLPARLILVPKTSKSPRLIAAEPSGHAFLQGGLNEAIMRRCEQHWLTRGQVNFTDQTINQRLARSSSVDQKWATIDLSDASDLMRAELVRELFPTEIGWALDLLRTHEVVDAKERSTTLTTFGCMGNGLTFSVMSVVLYSLLVGSLLWQDGIGPRCTHSESECCSLECFPPSHLRIAARRVFVYGDDIIVRQEDYASACSALIRFGFKPNEKKSFTRGLFRESCGSDWYRGTQVRPVYARSYLRWNSKEPSRLASTVALSNLLFAAGLRKTAGVVLGSLGRKLPYGPPTASYLSIHRDWLLVQFAQENRKRGFKVRFDRDLHTLVIRAPVLRPRTRRYKGSDKGRYLAALTRREVDQAPLVNDGTRPSLIKLGWRRIV